MSDKTTFVLVGHCGADSYSLTHAIGRAVPGAAVILADDMKSLEAAGADAVLLINRVLDGNFGTRSGNDLIRKFAATKPAPKMVLISNYSDAQDDAVAAGALRGFGKSQLGAKETTALLRSLAEAESAKQG